MRNKHRQALSPVCKVLCIHTPSGRDLSNILGHPRLGAGLAWEEDRGSISEKADVRVLAEKPAKASVLPPASGRLSLALRPLHGSNGKVLHQPVWGRDEKGPHWHAVLVGVRCSGLQQHGRDVNAPEPL